MHCRLCINCYGTGEWVCVRLRNNLCKDDSALFSRFLHVPNSLTKSPTAIKLQYMQTLWATIKRLSCSFYIGRSEITFSWKLNICKGWLWSPGWPAEDSRRPGPSACLSSGPLSLSLQSPAPADISSTYISSRVSTVTSISSGSLFRNHHPLRFLLRHQHQLQPSVRHWHNLQPLLCH